MAQGALSDQFQQLVTSSNYSRYLSYFLKTLKQFDQGADLLTVIAHQTSTLATFFDKNAAPLSLHQVKQIAGQLMRGLGYLHNHHLVHCDICPANIYLVSPQYSKEGYYDICTERFRKRDVLTDPRIRIAFMGDTRNEGTMTGTDRYRSPELILGLPDVNYKTDNFSLGCVIAEMALNYSIFPRISSSSYYARDSLLMMEHTIEFIPPRMVSEIRRIYPYIFDEWELVQVDSHVHHRAKLHVQGSNRIEDLIRDKDLCDIVYALMRINPEARWDLHDVLERSIFFRDRLM